MAANLKFVADDSADYLINLDHDGDRVLFNIETPKFDTQIPFNYETALAIKKQLELMLKEIKPA